MSQTLVIRSVQKTEVEALSDLAIQTYSEAFGHTFSDTDLASHLKKHLSPECFSRILNEDVVLLAEVENRLVGYVQFGAMNSSSECNLGLNEAQELRRLYVHTKFQNRGYGTLLMEATLRHPLLNRAASIYLDVWEHNEEAQRFYRRFGFEVIGTRTFEVESGAATSLDVIMVRRGPAEE